MRGGDAEAGGLEVGFFAVGGFELDDVFVMAGVEIEGVRGFPG